MDRTELTLETIKSHIKIKKILTRLSYAMISFGILFYIVSAFTQKNKAIKLVAQYKQDPDSFTTEKVMTNPHTIFQYSDDHIYYIKAKSAVHRNDNNLILNDVFASSDMGNITAGRLDVNESGDHLIFSKNPIVILNKTEKIN